MPILFQKGRSAFPVDKSLTSMMDTLTRGGRQKGSSTLASYSSGSKATNVLGSWSPYDGAFKCVHQESEKAVWALGCSPVDRLLLLHGHIEMWILCDLSMQLPSSAPEQRSPQPYTQAVLPTQLFPGDCRCRGASRQEEGIAPGVPLKKEKKGVG